MSFLLLVKDFGRSHVKNDQGFDLTVDETVLASLEEEAKTYLS